MILKPFGITASLAVAFWLALLPMSGVHAQGRAGLPDFADLVEQVSPSVVNIRVMRKISSLQAEALRGGAEDDDDDTPSGKGSQPQAVPPQIAELLRRFGIQVPQNNTPGSAAPSKPDAPPKPDAPAAPEREVQRGVGSGFVLTADGLIMTNAHVVAKADTLLVRLTDKREFKAKVIGADKRSDIALLKIEASGLPAVKLGNVQRLRVGEWVLAIGSPFNLDNTVTAGIVSGKHRDTGDLVPKIQTDVAINPGNSGGPLINMRGEVVGVNSMIYSNVGGYLGVSFAIPIDEAQRISAQMQAGGKVERGMLGVEMAPVSAELATALGLDKPQGVFVRRVVPGTGAEQAGVRAGDIITAFAGQSIETMAELQRRVFALPPGQRSTLTLLRRGQTLTLPITLSQLDAPASTASGAKASAAPVASGTASPSHASQLGLELAPLSAEQKTALNITSGVWVRQASKNAAVGGLRAGDVVVALGSAEVVSPEQAEQVLSAVYAARAEHKSAQPLAKALVVHFYRLTPGAASGSALAYALIPF